MSRTPEFPNPKTYFVADRLLRPLNPEAQIQELYATRRLHQLAAVLEELQKPPEERSAQILNNGGLGYLSEHITAGVLTPFFQSRGINLEVEVASVVFDRADKGVVPFEFTINSEGKTVMKNGSSNLNGSEDGLEDETVVHLSEYNRTADLFIREKGDGRAILAADATLSRRKRKLSKLTPKARRVRRFEHPRLGAFAVFIVSLDRRVLPWDENFELVASQAGHGPLDIEALTINKDNILVKRFLDEILLDIKGSLPESDGSGKVTKKGKLHKDGEIDWALVNVATYFYSKLGRIRNALQKEQPQSVI